ncbi:hypothetical protein E4U32_002870 [Claviceps aff. humidiphila group G2b]|nr:hypothetical protein E4U32_002870 [Claviceps aff. humidiphila group G2b]
MGRFVSPFNTERDTLYITHDRWWEFGIRPFGDDPDPYEDEPSVAIVNKGISWFWWEMEGTEMGAIVWDMTKQEFVFKQDSEALDGEHMALFAKMEEAVRLGLHDTMIQYESVALEIRLAYALAYSAPFPEELRETSIASKMLECLPAIKQQWCDDSAKAFVIMGVQPERSWEMEGTEMGALVWDVTKQEFVFEQSAETLDEEHVALFARMEEAARVGSCDKVQND